MMNKLILTLALIFLTAGCRQDSSSPGPTNLGLQTPQNETLLNPPFGNSNNSTQGGGVDSSGGDLITSSEHDVNEALKDLENKVYTVFLRLNLEIVDAEKTEFEMNFGNDSYNLIRGLLINPGRLNKMPGRALHDKDVRFNLSATPCEGDHQNKAGSAKWSGNTPEICISRPSLRKMSPDSLQIDLLALAAHEIAHLYGYDESKAQAVQAFVIRNKGLLWPPKDQLNELLQNADEFLNLFSDFLMHYRHKRDQKLCNTNDLLMESLVRIYKNPKKTTSLILPSYVRNRLSTLSLVFFDISENCQKGDLKAVRQITSRDAWPLFGEMVNANNTIRYIVDPIKPGALYPTFTFLNVMTVFEDGEIVKAINPQASPSERIEMEDVVCKVEYFENGKMDKPRDVKIFSGDQLKGNKDEGVGTFPVTFLAERPFMLRRIKNQRGVGFGFMSEQFAVKNQKNMFGTNGGGSLDHEIFVSALIPGVLENFQFEAISKIASIRVRCGFMRQNKVPDLTYEVAAKPNPDQKDPNDSYFMSAPKSPVMLRIRLNKHGQKDTKGGPDLGVQTIKEIRFNGHITLYGETDKCTIAGSDLEKLKLDGAKLAKEIQNGKYKEITCDMNGKLDATGKSHHASWAFGFDFK